MTTGNATLGMFAAWLVIFVIALALSGCSVARETNDVPSYRIDQPHHWDGM